MVQPLLSALNGFSYKEKSILITLVAVAVIYGAYFWNVISGQPPQSAGGLLGTMIGLVVALVVVHVVFHIVISLDADPETDDERDRAIRRQASVLGYNILSVGVLAVMGRVLILGWWGEQGQAAAAASPVDIVNLLLACVVVSEIVYYAAQLVMYRRGLMS